MGKRTPLFLGRPATNVVEARMPRGGEGRTNAKGGRQGKPRNEPWQIHNYARAAAFRRLPPSWRRGAESLTSESGRNSRGDRLGNGPRKLGAIRDARTHSALVRGHKELNQNPILWDHALA